MQSESVRVQKATWIPARESRRSFALNVVNGALFGLSETLVDTNLVLVLFLSRLTGSNLMLGLLGPIAAGGWFLPQLFLSGWIQQKPQKIVVYRLVSVIRLVTWGFLVVTLWTVQGRAWLLIVFYLTYTVMRLSAGLSGIPYLEVTAKTVPSRWRGRLFALRLLFGGLLGLLGSRVVRWALEGPIPYPHNYALLVSGALVAVGLAMLAFSLVREPDGATRPATSVHSQVRRGLAVLREDADYRNVLLARSFLLLAAIALPFYTVLARRELGAPEHVAGDYLLVLTLVKLLVNYPWGWLADTKGLRWVSRAASVGWAMTAALGLLLLWGVSRGMLQNVPFPAYMLAYPLFVLMGVFGPADGVTGFNLLLAVAPEDDRPLYLGFANTTLGVVALLSGLGGGLVDLFGLGALFGVAGVMAALAFVFLGRVRRPAV